MEFLVTALSVAAFLAAFRWLGLVARAQAAIATSRRAAAVMGDKTLDDDAKEAAVQRAATDLLKGFAGLVLRIAGVLLAAYLPIAAFDAAGLLPQAEALAFLLRIDVIAVTTLVVIAAVWVSRRLGSRPRP